MFYVGAGSAAKPKANPEIAMIATVPIVLQELKAVKCITPRTIRIKLISFCNILIEFYFFSFLENDDGGRRPVPYK
jgi:hypothetical protein